MSILIILSLLTKAKNVIISGKNVFSQTIDSDYKRDEERRKLKPGQGEDYTKGCLLDYEYIKTHYRLITADWNRRKKLDDDLKAIQQIEFVRQLTKYWRCNYYWQIYVCLNDFRTASNKRD